ncbi:hypothetical protein L0F63_002935 [Massospora cicadina]|nr:hypothetical protein L0F63_002935 [Massospora cicadina]
MKVNEADRGLIGTPTEDISFLRPEKVNGYRQTILDYAGRLLDSEFPADGDRVIRLQVSFSEFVWPDGGPRWMLKLSISQTTHTFTNRDKVMYEALHAPILSLARALCPNINTTAVVAQSRVRLPVRVYIMRNRGSLDECIQADAGLIYALVTEGVGQYIVVLRPASLRHDFLEFNFEGEARSPKSWGWAFVLGAVYLDAPKKTRFFHSCLFSPTSEFTKKSWSGQRPYVKELLDRVAGHFSRANRQASGNAICRFTHEALLSDEEAEGWSHPPPRLTFDSAVEVSSLAPDRLVLVSGAALSSAQPSPNGGSSISDLRCATPLDQSLAQLQPAVEQGSVLPAPRSEPAGHHPLVKSEFACIAPSHLLPPNHSKRSGSNTPPVDVFDSGEGPHLTRLDRVSWFTASTDAILPLLVNQLKAPEYAERAFLRPDELQERPSLQPRVETAASVPRKRIFSEYVIMRALVTELGDLPVETLEHLQGGMGAPLTDGHFKVIFAHPVHKATRVVSLFKCLTPENLPSRLNELALLVKFRGRRGFSQILSAVLDSQRQLVGFTLKRHAATFKELLHRGALSPQVKLGLVYRLARVLRDLHSCDVSHRDFSEVNLMVDQALFEEIRSSPMPFNRPRKQRRLSTGPTPVVLEGRLEDLISEDPVIIDFGKSASLSPATPKLSSRSPAPYRRTCPPPNTSPSSGWMFRMRASACIGKSIVTLPGTRRSHDSAPVLFDGYKEDVYGYGIVAFRVITGIMPWGGLQESCLARLREVAGSEAEQQRYLLADLPHAPYWRRLLLKALHPDPAVRWSMARVVTYLQSYPNALLKELHL